MNMPQNHHPEPSTNGTPQVVAVGFLALVVFMLLLPMARVSVDGTVDTRLLLEILKTSTGFNVYAFLLLLVPIVGIAVAMLAHSTWRIASAGVAVVAVILVPLTLMVLSRGMREVTNGMAHVAPGLASYVLLLGYLILAFVTGTAALRAHH